MFVPPLGSSRCFFPFHFRTCWVQIIAICDFVFWRGRVLGNLSLFFNLFYDYWETIRNASLLFLSLHSDTRFYGARPFYFKSSPCLTQFAGGAVCLIGEALGGQGRHFHNGLTFQTPRLCVENKDIARRPQCWSKI